MRLDPVVFWNFSLKEWLLAQQGFFESETQKMRNSWEIARWQAYIGALPYSKEGKLPSPKSLVTFPWEKGPDVEALNEEDEDYFARKFGKYINENMEFVN